MDPKLTRSYQAKQAKPVFLPLPEDPDLEAEEKVGLRLALFALALLAAAFIGFFGYLTFTNP